MPVKMKGKYFLDILLTKTIIGNKILPGYLDKYLGKTGYNGQQTNNPVDPNRPNNLWESIPGDHGAHCPFYKNTMHWCPMFFIKENKWLVLAAACAAFAGVSVLKNKIVNN